MVADQLVQSIDYSGSAKSKQLAAKAFEILRAQGMFMSDNAPIRVSVEALSAFLQTTGDATPSQVETALRDNPDVFGIETREDKPWVVTTRAGRHPVEETESMSHTFAARFLTPEPKPIAPPAPRRERARVDPSWANFSISDYADLEEEEDFDDELLDQEVDVVVAEAVVIPDDIDFVVEPLEPLTEETEPEVAAASAAAPAPAPESTPAPELVAEHVAAEPVPEAAPKPVAAPKGAGTDLSSFEDAAIADALRVRLASDVHVAHFGDQWMSEDRVPRLSRGDLRRIKEYIEEQEQPLTDAMLVQDVLGSRANSAEFDLMQFAVNFRLSREHKEFDFVGTTDQRFWSTTSLAPIGTTRRKPNEIGTDYRFLLEEVGDTAIEHRSVTSIDHIVTFYEYNLGLLPYDADMQRLLPAPLLPDQRSVVLTFEIPQLYTTYLAELRYPTPNRGGFLLGLDDFFAESLVPGAMIAISATENDGHYKLEFIASKDRSERLLELDDRRSPRYLFRPTTFASEVADEWLISEDRFPTLGSEKPLDDKIRRRPDAVLEATFERIGIDDGEGGKLATFADLLAAANVERPFTDALLRNTLSQHTDVTGEGDTFIYAAES
ncbi:MAG: hypothetical protein ACR2OU_08940 [Thermomicrobiales bacterium]